MRGRVDHACGAPPLALQVNLGCAKFAYSGCAQPVAAWSSTTDTAQTG
jgi:hypothetical protein